MPNTLTLDQLIYILQLMRDEGEFDRGALLRHRAWINQASNTMYIRGMDLELLTKKLGFTTQGLRQLMANPVIDSKHQFSRINGIGINHYGIGLEIFGNTGQVKSALYIQGWQAGHSQAILEVQQFIHQFLSSIASGAFPPTDPPAMPNQPPDASPEEK